MKTEKRWEEIRDWVKCVKNMKIWPNVQANKILHTNVVVGVLFSIRFPLPNGSKGSCFATILVLSNAVKGSAAKPFYGIFFLLVTVHAYRMNI